MKENGNCAVGENFVYAWGMLLLKTKQCCLSTNSDKHTLLELQNEVRKTNLKNAQEAQNNSCSVTHKNAELCCRSKQIFEHFFNRL